MTKAERPRWHAFAEARGRDLCARFRALPFVSWPTIELVALVAQAGDAKDGYPLLAPPSFFRVPTRAAVLCGLGAYNLACGSRSPLPARPTCEEEGERSPCQDICGEGWLVCEEGRWSECRVPIRSEACADSCGPGLRTCENGAWSECEIPPVEEPCATKCGPGTIRCENGVWSPCDAPLPLPPALRTRVRDFSDTHPDFELPWAEIETRQPELGLLLNELGPDDKPVFLGPSWSITSPASFAEWYRDTSGVNLGIDIDLPLIEHPLQEGRYFYKNDAFFPIDNQLLGNEGWPHNYHFTLEASATFTYVGGEVFSFYGDDDFWVFINRKLAIDIGGLHPPRGGGILLDEAAERLGLRVGEVFPIHLFFAERHTTASNFTIETTLNDIGPCP